MSIFKYSVLWKVCEVQLSYRNIMINQAEYASVGMAGTELKSADSGKVENLTNR